MLYEANPALYPAYTACLATAIDPDGPWTKYAYNPVFGGTDLGASPSNLLKIGGGLYTWFHGNCESGGIPVTLPTDVARAYATSPQNWTCDPTSVLVRATADEGAGLDIGQCADCCPVVDGGTIHLFYTATNVGNGTGPDGSFMIKLATAPVAPGLAPVVSRTIPLTSGTSQNFAMTAGEHVVVTFTTDTPVAEVASAELATVSGPRNTLGPSVSRATITADSGSATVTVELLAVDTQSYRGVFSYQLWLYDSAGDGIVAATGRLTILPSDVTP